MQPKMVERALERVGIGATLQFARTLTSAVTTAWGVDWDEVYIARDLMQNFFDANRARLDAVVVRAHGTDVVISAPAGFNLERLFYLGSEKGEGDVGQYGEGFKVAATCLLRDHRVTPIAASGHDVVVLRVAARSIADTRMRPVEYDFYVNDRGVPGTVLVLPGCSPKLAAAVAAGLTHFFHDRNPLLGRRRWADPRGSFALYDATDGRGHVFYRRLKRGDIDGIPVVLVIDRPYPPIERRISKDRDRNAFGDEVMRLFYRYFARYGLRWHPDGQQVVVEAAKALWEKGHPLLAEIADTVPAGTPWPATTARRVFGDAYYARSGRLGGPAAQLQVEGLERRWREEGRTVLPGYFRKFGVPSAEDEVRRALEKAVAETKRRNQRTPTTGEQEAIRLLSHVLRELAPAVMAVFDLGTTSYTVARTEAVLGQLKSDRPYRSREVFLAERVFVADFPQALATFLHEHAHVFGYDGSRTFSDALTELLEVVVQHRHDLDPYEAQWAVAREAVAGERRAGGAALPADGPEGWVAALDEPALRDLVGRLPPVVLRRLRRESA